MAPVIDRIRGVPTSLRRRTIEGLTDGQRGLFAFWILFGHGQRGVSALLGELGELTELPGFWEALQEGARRLQFPEMSRLVDQIQGLRRPGARASPERVAEAERSLREVLARGGQVAASYIRSHPDHFVQVER